MTNKMDQTIKNPNRSDQKPHITNHFIFDRLWSIMRHSKSFFLRSSLLCCFDFIVFNFFFRWNSTWKKVNILRIPRFNFTFINHAKYMLIMILQLPSIFLNRFVWIMLNEILNYVRYKIFQFPLLLLFVYNCTCCCCIFVLDTNKSINGYIISLIKFDRFYWWILLVWLKFLNATIFIMIIFTIIRDLFPNWKYYVYLVTNMKIEKAQI